MTCIVGYVDGNDIYMGGDRAGVGGYSLRVRDDTKVFRTGDFVFGYTSSFRMGQLIRFKFSPPKHHPDVEDFAYMCTSFIDTLRECLRDGGYAKDSNNVETGGTFLVGYKGTIYQIYNDFQVSIQSTNFDACGCGEEYAMGAMHILDGDKKMSPQEKVETALKSAESYSAGVRGPFDVIKLEGEKDAKDKK